MKWISVDERLPDEFSTILVARQHTGHVSMANYSTTKRFWVLAHGRLGTEEWVEVTHWMPLPPPPTED